MQFHSHGDGATPVGQVAFDSAGNLYGTTAEFFVGEGNGNVFELTPTSGGNWNETTLYTFQGGSDGKYPYAGVVLDSSGNLYGATVVGAPTMRGRFSS